MNMIERTEAAGSIAGAFRRLTASEAWDLVLERSAGDPRQLLVLDVRDEEAFGRSHVDGARHFNPAHATELLAATPKTASVLVYCYQGHASQAVAAMFGDFGFSEAFSVDGGFEALAKEHLARGAADGDEGDAALPAPELRYIVGDCVYARELIRNDGGIPGLAPDAIVANAGGRGVIAQVGHPEAEPRQTIYAVRFEDAEGNLGPVVGCLPEELTHEPMAKAGPEAR
jgi:nitrogen fixation protein NifZ